MNKHTKAVLTVVALSMLALPAYAEEAIWDCEMTAFITTTKNGFEEFQNEKFKMLVDSDQVIYDSTGALQRVLIPMADYRNSEMWVAYGREARSVFHNGELHFTSLSSTTTVAISALCKKW